MLEEKIKISQNMPEVSKQLKSFLSELKSVKGTSLRQISKYFHWLISEVRISGNEVGGHNNRSKGLREKENVIMDWRILECARIHSSQQEPKCNDAESNDGGGGAMQIVKYTW